MGQILECSFNIFNEGRKYTGNHRKYMLENARQIAVMESTQERIRLREALGYYGHGRRILAGKMNLGEVEAVKLPDGSSVIVSNIPSNVTTKLVVEDDGTVRHAQEILTTETGMIVEGLHQSKVGGFSWACPGSDGGAARTTRLSGFAGFDYVLNPGFAYNRGYILESANDFDKQAILESIAAVVQDDAKAEGLLAGWQADAHFVALEFEDKLAQAELYETALLEKLTGREKDILELDRKLQLAVQAQQAETVRLKQICDFIVESAPFFIPEDVKHAMMEGSFHKVVDIFEAAERVDFSQYPIPGHAAKPPQKSGVKADPVGWEV
jgi:hypothetical protein